MSQRQRMDHRINELREAIASYRPGSTFRFDRQRPSELPAVLRIGLFGPTGVGKSALINSFNYASGTMWENIAPEGFADEASKTLVRDAFEIANAITVIDNRGMRSLGGPFMVEVGHQMAGVYGDGERVNWDGGAFRRLVSGLKRAFLASKESEIHCAVLVISALNLSLQASDLTELIKQIKTMTGHPPIVVITHRKDPSVREDVLSVFRSGLQELRVDYVFELENYTTANHDYDPEKHLALMEALYQCAIVGDKVMKFKESEGGCTIL